MNTEFIEPDEIQDDASIKSELEQAMKQFPDQEAHNPEFDKDADGNMPEKEDYLKTGESEGDE
ncbi:MAG: hypothetical protein JWO50_159 [Candidatus Kaiserbacteria bacterium]|nr:hypothetical protein [Candidatus Kaiserbacteria bacterium]